MFMRYVFGVSLGIVVTFVLFVVMQSLIKSDRSAITERPPGIIVDLVRLLEDEEPEITDRRPTLPPPPEEPPQEWPDPVFDPGEGSIGPDIGPVVGRTRPDIGKPGTYGPDGEYLPIVKVAPVYPRRAQTRGIEGFVLLEFVVTRTGAVRDPVILESIPPGIFDRAAKAAALKFKYKPKVLNGEPIDFPGVRNRITFELTD